MHESNKQNKINNKSQRTKRGTISYFFAWLANNFRGNIFESKKQLEYQYARIPVIQSKKYNSK